MSFTPPINKWTWTALGPQTPASKPKPMSIRTKALIQAPVMALVGSLLFFKWGHVIGACFVWTLAILVLAGGLFHPPLFHAFEKFGQKLAHWVGTGLTWALLLPFFYLCFVPGRFIMALRGRDPLTRKFPSDEPTYWIPRKPVPDLNQYKKQH